MTREYQPSDLISRLPQDQASAPIAQLTLADIAAVWNRPAMLFVLADRLQADGLKGCAWIASKRAVQTWLKQIKPGEPVDHELWKLAGHYGHDIDLATLAERIYPNHTFDTALPQAWVDATYQVQSWSPLDLATRCVWGYGPSSALGCPMPITQLAAEFLRSRAA